MSIIELILIGIFSFFALLPVPRLIYKNDVGALQILFCIGSIAGLIVLFVHHFFPNK